MSRGSEELTTSRKNEIINAFEELYQTMSFRNISMREIGEKTSMTRSSIYNYFQTKEEIFLALIAREFQSWCSVLQEITAHDSMTLTEFAEAIASSLQERRYFLKLISWNHYELEENSRTERLAEVQQVTYNAMQTIFVCLDKFFPSMTDTAKKEFQQNFFIFLYGIDSYTNGSNSQKKAMEYADIPYYPIQIYDAVYTFILHYLKQEV
jgi:AcrR family transcriptional regulator